MPRLLRKFSKGEVFFVSNRVAEGLPFVPNILINIFLNGILARALKLHPGIDLCAYIFMGNHYHLILVLNEGGEVLKSFMEYLDGEIAKVINRLRGRCNQNVWASRYDAQPMLTPEAVIKKLKYIYLNPIVPGLVKSINNYPGISSWKTLTKGIQKSYRFFGSAGLSRLPYGSLSRNTMSAIIREKSKSKKFIEKNLLRVDPFSWVHCFSGFKNKNPEVLKKELISEIKKEELKLKRKRETRQVIGINNLISQCFHKRFKSKKYQKRSICISTCSLIREEYLNEYRDFVEKCRSAFLKLKLFSIHVEWPPGAFPPTRSPMASLVRIEI